MFLTNEELESALKACGDASERVDLLNRHAWDLRHRDSHRAQTLAQRAQEYSTSGSYEEDRYERGFAYALCTLGSLSYIRGEHGKALSLLLEAASIFDILNDLVGWEQAEYEMGMVYFRLGEYDRSLEHLFEALFFCEQLENREGEARVLSGIAMNYHHSDLELAEKTFRKALQIVQEQGNSLGELNIRNSIALCLLYSGQLEEAENEMTLVFQLMETLEIVSRLNAALHHTHGQILMRQERWEEAVAAFGKTLAFSRQAGENYGLLKGLRSLGQAKQKLEACDEAETHLLEALKISEELQSRQEQSECHQALARYFKAREMYQKALHHHELFHETEKSVHSEKANARIQSLQVMHKTEIALKEAQRWKKRSEGLEADLIRHEIEQQQLKKTNRELQQLANLDEVTGLANRRRFDLFLEQAIRRLRRKQKPLCILLLEIDGFADQVEVHGRNVRDYSLKKVARVLQSEAPASSSFLSRTSGEEFAVILPGAEAWEAIQFARSVQKAIEGQPVVLKEPQIRLELTLSVGITCHIPDPMTNESALMQIVDTALFEARRQGGNRFVIKTIKSTPHYVC
jgi:diguanylate cyclase (GGDEF)-like protein